MTGTVKMPSVAKKLWRTIRHLRVTTATDGRDGEIRTLDLLLPKQALYQAKLRPDFRLKSGQQTAKPGT